MGIWKSTRLRDAIATVPGADPLSGDELVAIVQDGQARTTTVSAIGRGVVVNDIGRPNTPGVGQGICPAPPPGYTPMPGCFDPTHPNWGTYLNWDGSREVWVPAHWVRIGHPDNPTWPLYGVNSISILPIFAFADSPAANALGYYLDRAFINAGAEQPGVFRDKYDCSNNNGIASSMPLANPLVSGPLTGQVGFNTLDGAPQNIHAGAIAAAKTRSQKHFPSSVFVDSMLANISRWLAQSSVSSVYCAWFDPAGTTNFPKGCNNTALADANDLSVTFTSAGSPDRPNIALTGSGVPIAKTTHNGQACGITDVNGNIWRIALGVTCIATSKPITAATQADPCQITVPAHGLTTGDVVMITAVTGMTQLNDKIYVITVDDPDTITLDGINATGYNAYTGAGSMTTGTFHILKPGVDIAQVTAGNSGATDHWGAAGVAAQFDPITLNFATTPSANGLAQRMGNAANQVFGWGTDLERALTSAGMPIAAGFSVGGTNLMGSDYYYQYIRNELCVLVGGSWGSGSSAGVGARYLDNARNTALYDVGFAAASYL